MDSDGTNSKGKEVVGAEPPRDDGAITLPVAKAFYAVHYGRDAGVYTVEEKARATREKFVVFTELEDAMKYYQLGYNAHTQEFELPVLTEGNSFTRNAYKGQKFSRVYIRADGDRIGVYIAEEKMNLVYPGVKESEEWTAYFRAIGVVVDMMFGAHDEDCGGLLDPKDYYLLIVVPDVRVVRKLKSSKALLVPGVTLLMRSLAKYPVLIYVNKTMCMLQVALEEPEKEKQQQEEGTSEEKN